MAAPPIYPYAPGVRIHAVAVTVGATVYNPPLTKLWVATSGTLTVLMVGDSTAVSLGTIPAGTWLNDIAVQSVTAGTATGIVGFY